MITNEVGDKCSAKELAQEVMLECLGRIEFWLRSNQDRIKDMTDRELTMVNDQLQKLHNRAARAMGIKAEDIDLRNSDPNVEG